MSSDRDPPRLRSMGADLPGGLATALESDLAEFPQAEQMADLTNRLAPLFGTATAAAAAAIPAGLMAPKAPLSLAGTLKVFALKWGSTVILPLAIGAASGGVALEVREYALSNGDTKSVAKGVGERSRNTLPPLGIAPNRTSAAPRSEVDETQAIVAPTAEPPAAQVRSGAAATAPLRIAAPPASQGSEPPPVVIPEDLTEFELIDRAHRALARQPALAHQWVDEHMRRFPQGTFVQERETVGIEALVREGRMVEARSRAFQFRTRFPQSTYLRRIDALLRNPNILETESN